MSAFHHRDGAITIEVMRALAVVTACAATALVGCDRGSAAREPAHAEASEARDIEDAVPVGDLWQNLVLIERTPTEVTRKQVLPVRFVPMTGKAQKRQ